MWRRSRANASISIILLKGTFHMAMHQLLPTVMVVAQRVKAIIFSQRWTVRATEHTELGPGDWDYYFNLEGDSYGQSHY